jgi:predicted AAA+ superfamily ATPase
MNPREQHHLDNAEYFTAIRGANPRTRIRREFLQMHQAEDWAVTQYNRDGRTMIYAVSPDGAAWVKNV